MRALAEMIARNTGAQVAMVDNPRNEAPENTLRVSNATFIGLGLEPVTLAEGLMEETRDIAARYRDRCLMHMIPCVSTWTDRQRPGVVPQDMVA